MLEDPEKSRKLIIPTTNPDLQVVLVRATDVPTYVQYGGADLGRDQGHPDRARGQGAALRWTCRSPSAASAWRCARTSITPMRAPGARLKATKYVNIAREFFAAKGVHVDLIKLYGSMELAP